MTARKRGSEGVPVTGETIVATTVKCRGEHGLITTFGDAVLMTDPPAPDGRVRFTLRYESKSLFGWWCKHPDDVYALDVWAPVPPMTQATGRLPWLRMSAPRVRLESSEKDPASGGFVSVGWAEQDTRTGDVLRMRQDITAPSTEDVPGDSVQWRKEALS